MKSVSISGSPRENVGKKDAVELRRNGKVPCVLYGGKEQIHFAADLKDFKTLVYSPEVHTVELNVGGNVFNAVLQEIQFHPVNDSILHIDFKELVPAKMVRMDIPVKLVGTAPGVKAGGKLVKKLRLIKVSALPADLPDYIEVSIDNLEVGGIIQVKDLSAGKLTFLNSSNSVIATVKGKRGGTETAAAAAPAKKK